MKRLMIVDDIQQNLYLLEVLLTTNGYETVKASNGIEALELARQNPPEMIISDILMPGMDGCSLCRIWKSDKILKDVPFIFYTATYTDERDEKLALSLGADRYIIKPVEPNAFLAILQETIRNHEAGKQNAHPDTFAKEEVFYKEYNQALVRKLEEKMEQLKRSNNRLASLYKTSCELHTAKSSSELVEILLNNIIETAGYQQANYFSFDERSNKLFLQTAVGFSDETLTTYKELLIFKLGEAQGVVGLVAQNGQTLIIPDTEKDPNWIMLDRRIQSALFVPVHFKKTLLGVIALFGKGKNAFSEEDAQDVAVLANNLAIAIINNKNLEKVQKQLTRISALHNIDTAINSSMDLRVIFNILLDHVTTQLNVDAADILIFRVDESICEYAAGRGFNTRTIESRNVYLEREFAKKVALEKRIVYLNGLPEQVISPAFSALWEAEGFATYLGAPLVTKGAVVGVLEVFLRTPFEPDAEWKDYFETLAGQAAIAIDNTKMFNDLKFSNIELSVAYDATIRGWSRAMDLRDQETEGHTQRVTEMTVRLAEAIGISSEQIVHIRRGALLHDIGKLGVPDAILLKPDKLTEEEWVIMRKHPIFAYEMLQPIDYLKPALDIPFCHHEKWDGTGYPRGLKGEEIPLAARLFAVVDVWDALRSERAYQKAWPEEEVIAYIREQAGKHFDPEVVRKFLEIIGKE